MNKQIEEMKDCIDSLYGCDCAYFGVDGIAIATVLFEAGFCKQDEVVQEIAKLQEQNAYLIKEAVFSPMERAHNTIAVRTATVQELVERLKAEKFSHKNFGDLVCVDDIDRIASEFLKGHKDEKTES